MDADEFDDTDDGDVDNYADSDNADGDGDDFEGDHDARTVMVVKLNADTNVARLLPGDCSSPRPPRRIFRQ